MVDFNKTRIPLFRRFVLQNFPFIEQDFDALTDYELICKVVEYLNKVIVSTNANSEQVEILTNAFNDLQSYVDHYFDNLDVQEEINNKLDAMVEAGTLQEIITTYIQSNVAWTFDTVAGMKAATNLVDGSFAQTLGYYTRNDGGASMYKIRSKTDSDTTDEMLLVAIGDDLVAELVLDTTINSKQCGIKGDGTTDETTKLNTFFALSTDYDKILNKGVYLTTGTVFIKGRWADTNPSVYRIFFDQASIKYTGTANGCSVVVFNHKRSEINGLNISTSSNANYVQVLGCWYDEFINWHCKHLHIDTDSTLVSSLGYDSASLMNVTFTNLRLISGTLFLTRASASTYINSIFFNNSVFGGASNNHCIEVSGTAGSFQNIVFQNSDLSYATNSVLKLANALDTQSTFTFYSCYFDSKIPLLYNNDNQGAIINTYGIFSPHSDYQLFLPREYGKVITQTHIGDKTGNGNFIGTENVNYVKNGDISSSNEISGGYSEMFGVSSAFWNKEYVTSSLNANNRARKITLLQTLTSDSTTINIAAINAPRDGVYTPYIRFKITQGTFTNFDLHFHGYANILTRSQITNGKEMLLIGERNIGHYSAGDSMSLYLKLDGVNGSDDIIFEVYEVGVTLGSTYIPYAKLHEAAKL